MTFENISQDTSCDCIKLSISDFTTIFARKIGMTTLPKERDFKSKWEGGRQPDNLSDCKSVCSFKGISIHLWNEQSKEAVLNLYIESSKIAPGQKKQVCVFKLKQDGGQVKPSPLEKDEFHYDLLKSDQFSIDSILSQDMIEINV